MRALTCVPEDRERGEVPAFVVCPDRITSTTESALVDITTASVTESVGGVSITM